MKKLLVLAVTVMLLGVSSLTMAKTFVDVPSGHWAEDAVQTLADKGLIEGYPDGTYKGDRQLTRYEYAMVVARMMELLDKTYCKKEGCQITDTNLVSKADFEEAKAIVQKLAAEFKDELAALKVKVDENSAKIAKLETDVKTARIGNIAVSGNIRQRVDVPSTDFPDVVSGATFYTNYYQPLYDKTGTLALTPLSGNITAGYEMVPALNFDGKAGDNVTFSLGLDKSISVSTLGYDYTQTADEQGELTLNHAYVDVDFSPTVRELDLLKVRSGYQQFAFGPYGMIVDNSGVTSNAAIRLDIAKDIVSVTGIGALVGTTRPTFDGLGSNGKDVYAAARLGLDLSFIDLGANFLANGILQEKAWGADVVLPLLRKSPFLPELRAEYMTVTDLQSGATPAAGAKDDSFIVGIDLYKNAKAGLTLSYADLPATVAYSSLDANPFTEYDSLCPAGIEVGPATNCYSYEGRNLFPAGFEGLGLEASYIVFNNVTLAGKAYLGNFAGTDSIYTDGLDYPGFGAVSVSKPINDRSSFRVEYARQGGDFVSMDRVRGELLINF